MERPTRQLGRSGTMTRGEKRALEATADDQEMQAEVKRPKVPALASVIVEALKVDSLQKLCSSLEPILRRVVSEEVERALAKLGPARLQGSRAASPKRIEGPDGRNLQLHFRTRLSLPLFTGGKVEGEQGAAIHVVLIDVTTGMAVTNGPEASAKLDVVVLEGDFNKEDDDDWTEEEFESHAVKEREGKRPLLTGELQVTLKEGVGTLGELIFTDNSSWIRSRKFRLGLKVSSGYCEGIRVREAKTEAFTVKDHRGELYKKHYPPALKDEVWRLEKIGKDGAFHKKLNAKGINTVEDFLRLLIRDQQGLRNILGSGMSNKMWESLVEHAKTCVLSGKHYIFYSDLTRNTGAIFNNIYEFVGLINGAQFYSAESLTESQRLMADTLVKKAYDNWNTHVLEYDGEALLSFKQEKKAASTPNNNKSAPSSVSGFAGAGSSQNMALPATASAGSSLIGEGEGSKLGYNMGTSRYPSNQQTMQFDRTSFMPETQYNGSQFTRNSAPTSSTNSNLLALAPPPQTQQTLTLDFSHQQMDPLSNPYGRVDDYLMEEEIRMRSHEILENEEMQHLLRVLSMGGAQGTSGMADDGYGFSSYMSSSPGSGFGFDTEERGSSRSSSSGKAVVGWLKIKAAMRWGIFIRKKAAERRAQLVELDD
ncbi:Calmodulin-binding protein [Rhynchospora pubera]|uniref:Calmodulin-binding protein n=1 Tax=Rhynchospora pubera TaxID=906938 RepID=A0AAV8CDP4_9POAL|nr:Calmodulin-binding protein [Rhynchospora pubera]KAJ4765174.1 Calmodulin-binding protein [Rhynchospora pubera]